MDGIIQKIIDDIILNYPDSVIKFAAKAVKYKNYTEKDLIDFVKTIHSYNEDNPELIKKLIGESNTKKFLELTFYRY